QRRDQNPALAPPPTNVGHSPQPSTTVSGTVVAWPGVTRSTVKSTALLDGTVNVWPLEIGWPFSVTFAFWNVPNATARSGSGACELSGVDSMCTCSLPPPGAGAVLMCGRGAQSVAVTKTVTEAGLDWALPSLAT